MRRSGCGYAAARGGWDGWSPTGAVADIRAVMLFCTLCYTCMAEHEHTARSQLNWLCYRGSCAVAMLLRRHCASATEAGKIFYTWRRAPQTKPTRTAWQDPLKHACFKQEDTKQHRTVWGLLPLPAIPGLGRHPAPVSRAGPGRSAGPHHGSRRLDM